MLNLFTTHGQLASSQILKFVIKKLSIILLFQIFSLG